LPTPYRQTKTPAKAASQPPNNHTAHKEAVSVKTRGFSFTSFSVLLETWEAACRNSSLGIAFGTLNLERVLKQRTSTKTIVIDADFESPKNGRF
jgi:hypothetical protein